jgi:CTP:molybdopterin cytidylyltransferase MocA
VSKGFSAVILAAGYSGRMGVPKWSLIFDDKQTFVEKISHEFVSAGCEQIFLVVNDSVYLQLKRRELSLPDNLKIVINENPDLGRFYSLKKGVESCDSENPVCFTNIDNPFINSGLIKSLLSESLNADYISPSFEGKGGHPVVISSSVVKAIQVSQQSDTNLKDFLLKFKRKKIEVEDEKVILNINTQVDYQKHFL